VPDQFNAFVHGPRALLEPTADGPLDGLPFGVKDVIDVAGLPTGLGLPGAPRVATASNPAVEQLLAAGAICVGKTTTNQLAFGLSGTDTATPAPSNPRHPDRVPGGSSSGSAAAVAGGLVPFALATDFAGSVRVPASYCGVVGFRPTWGVVSTEGVSPLAPRFDTVGWFARDAATAALVGDVLLPPTPVGAPASCAVVVLEEALAVLGEPAGEALLDHARAIAERLGVPLRRHVWGTDLALVGRAFRARQLVDVAATPRDADLVERSLPQVAARFEQAAQTAVDDDLDDHVSDRLDRLRTLLGGGAVLVLPAAAGPAPLRTALTEPAYEGHRGTTIALNAVAGLLGSPCLVLPTPGSDVGTALVSAPGTDRELLHALSDEGALSDGEGLFDGPVPVRRSGDRDELLAAFYRYEQALVSGDRGVLNASFSAQAPCIRFAPEGEAFDRQEIARLRGLRPPGGTARELTYVSLDVLGPGTGIAATRFVRVATGVRGHQTQTWSRTDDG